MKTILFDIDGTLANIEHRRRYLKENKLDWKRFNAKMGDDTPNVPIVELYQTLKASGRYDLVILTGRNERFRQVTELWLTCHAIEFTELYMRADDDHRPDNEVKQDMLKLLQNKGKEILFVVDDRQQVVDMWRRNGITCLQCDEGDF